MSGAPWVRGNLFVMTLEEGRTWARDTAAKIDARLHDAAAPKRSEIIEQELLSQIGKACKKAASGAPKLGRHV